MTSTRGEWLRTNEAIYKQLAQHNNKPKQYLPCNLNYPVRDKNGQDCGSSFTRDDAQPAQIHPLPLSVYWQQYFYTVGQQIFNTSNQEAMSFKLYTRILFQKFYRYRTDTSYKQQIQVYICYVYINKDIDLFILERPDITKATYD